jgi:hypothetical protein
MKGCCFATGPYGDILAADVGKQQVDSRAESAEAQLAGELSKQASNK